MRWILFAVTLPWTLTVGWGWVLLLAAIGACGSLRFDDGLVLTAVWKPWAARLWRFSTTVGRGIIYQDGLRHERGHPLTVTEEHEGVHVRQVEDLMLLSFLVGFAVFLGVGIGFGDWSAAAWWWLGLWWSGGFWQAPNFVAAGLRHGWTLEGVYRGSEHELSAYSQTSRNR